MSEEIVVNHHSKFSKCPTDVYALVLYGYADLMSKNLADKGLVIDINEVISATIGNEVVGIMVFFETEADYIWINLAYVKEEHRNKGIYKAMLGCLNEEARSRDIKSLRSGTGIENEVMIVVKEKVGFVKTYIMHEYKIEDVDQCEK